MTWAQHMATIGTQGQWGGFADIEALATVLDCSVDVIDSNLRRRQFGPTTKPRLRTLLWRQGHYESVKERSETMRFSTLRVFVPIRDFDIVSAVFDPANAAETADDVPHDILAAAL